MIRGVFSSLRFPYGHFPTHDIKGTKLYSIVWEAIERLERLGFKVVALTSDALWCYSSNYFLTCTLQIKKYVTRPLIHTKENRNINFFPDVPHNYISYEDHEELLAFCHNNTRQLWVS